MADKSGRRIARFSVIHLTLKTPVPCNIDHGCAYILYIYKIAYINLSKSCIQK